VLAADSAENVRDYEPPQHHLPSYPLCNSSPVIVSAFQVTYNFSLMFQVFGIGSILANSLSVASKAGGI